MRSFSRNTKLAIGISFMLMVGGVQQLRGSDAKIYPLTTKMLEVINGSTDGRQAEDNLCKQGGVIRGSGFSAGDNCKLQDFARVATVICEKYAGYWDSKCGQNAKKVLPAPDTGTRVANARRFVNDAVKNKYPNVTNLICTPPRDKLPAGLKSIADESCGGAPAAAPDRPKTEAPALPKERAQKIVQEGVAYMDELKRVLQEGVKLKPVRGRTTSVAKKVTVEGSPISIPAFTIPEVTSEAERNDLIKAAQELSDALKGVSRALEQGDTLSEADVKETSKLKEDIEKAQTPQTLLQELKEEKAEVVQWSSRKERIAKELEKMRLGN